tara:strand:- start:230 stop:958 length:729 start_codon:yes stop_codon:yes gene_type:complete
MNPSQVAQLLASSLLNDKPKYKHVVPDLSELEEIPYTCGEHEYDTCPISMAKFKEGETIVKLPCGHIFDKDSITEWVTKEKATCPICRHKLKSVEVLDGPPASEEPTTPPPPLPPNAQAAAAAAPAAISQDLSGNIIDNIAGNSNIYTSILNMISTPSERRNVIFRTYFQRAMTEMINDLEQENNIINNSDVSNNRFYVNNLRNFNRQMSRNNFIHGSHNNEMHDVALQRALMESMRDQNGN